MKRNFLKLIFVLFVFISYHSNAQTISPVLVGTNVWFEPTDSAWQQMADAGLQSIRIGGARYDHTLPDFEQLLEWVNQIQKVGAEPIIQCSKYISVDSAAALVRFFNIEHGKNVKYWGIGNEPWLQLNRPSLDTMGAIIEAYWKPRAAAMKAVDPAIKLYGPNCCDYYDVIYDDLFGGKNDITCQVPGKDYAYCDGLSWHRYPQGDGNPGTEGADDLIERIKKAKQKTDEVNALQNRTGDDALGWGIGEFNSKGDKEVHTWGNGQMFGQVLGACMKYEATFATSWSMANSDFGMIDRKGVPRASYYHMAVIAQHFKGRYADGISTSDDIKVFGAYDGDRISVMILNREGGSQSYTLRLDQNHIAGDGLKLNVHANTNMEYADTISEQSTQVLIFQDSTITKWMYCADDFVNGRAPSISMMNLDH